MAAHAGGAQASGWIVNHKKIKRLMREHALHPPRRRRFVATTDSDHDEPVFPDRSRDREIDGPNQLWVADLTYIAILGGFVYALHPPRRRRFVATTDSDHDEPVFPDRSRDRVRLPGGDHGCVVAPHRGYALGRRIDARLTLAALATAIERRNPPAGCIHHSDSEYAVAGSLGVT